MNMDKLLVFSHKTDLTQQPTVAAYAKSPKTSQSPKEASLLFFHLGIPSQIKVTGQKKPLICLLNLADPFTEKDGKTVLGENGQPLLRQAVASSESLEQKFITIQPYQLKNASSISGKPETGQ